MYTHSLYPPPPALATTTTTNFTKQKAQHRDQPTIIIMSYSHPPLIVYLVDVIKIVTLKMCGLLYENINRVNSTTNCEWVIINMATLSEESKQIG